MTDRSKRPAYQWYPGDFRRDLALQACSWEARSLWRDMLDFMHDGEPYGHLTAGGVPLGADTLARLLGIQTRKVTPLIAELGAHGVFSRTEAGVIYSRRMVRDEVEYRAFVAKQTENGKHGGRPRKETQIKPNENPDETQQEPRRKPKGKAKKTSAVCSLQSAPAHLPPNGGAGASPPDLRGNGSDPHPASAEAPAVALPPPEEGAPNWPARISRALEGLGIRERPGAVGDALRPAVELWGEERVVAGLRFYFEKAQALHNEDPKYMTIRTFAKNPMPWIEYTLPAGQTL